MAALNELSDHTSLECGLTHHTYCINTYCESAATQLLHVACPVCRRTAVQISELRSQAMRDMVIPGRIPDPLIPGTGADSQPMLAGEQLVPETPPNAQPTAAMPPDTAHVPATPPQTPLMSQTALDDIGPASASPAAPQASPAAPQASMSASVFPTSDVALVHRPQYAPLGVLCGTCGPNVSLSRARCRSKMLQKWQCNKCEVTISQLRRGFGTWPSPGFSKISKEDQQAFCHDAQEMGGQDLVKRAEAMFNISEDMEGQYYMNGGTFLPLDVWARKGYDADAIKEKRSGGYSRSSCARSCLQGGNS